MLKSDTHKLLLLLILTLITGFTIQSMFSKASASKVRSNIDVITIDDL